MGAPAVWFLSDDKDFYGRAAVGRTIFDHNAILGPHSELHNFLFLNGFSEHGLQQSSAMRRGIAELVT